ncbi:YfiR family protein [Thaumasiovibrio subtropicus]|uniref:YfiR family protein n=1 Tax=Thaumasiovibrio subtropicus TaxID=1891207 RepID=UPI000B34AC6E|nr:YfiR family protein [Thaumasiovibrio subtropicus]
MRLFLLFLAMTLTSGIAVADDSEVTEREYKIKAGYIYNFIRYSRLKELKENIQVCSPSAPFISIANSVFGEREVNGRYITLHQVKDDIKGCHVVFISEDDVKWWEARKTTPLPENVLIVGESDDFAIHLGHINFVIVGSKVRFEINPQELRSSGLSISSTVLRLGKVVSGGPQ